MRAGSFFFALQHDLDVHRQLADHVQIRPQREQLRQMLALVVAGAASPDPSVAHDRLEWGVIQASGGSTGWTS
jgi:hypothetical protein